MSQLSQREVEARTTAVQLIVLAREAEETGIDKLLYFYVDEIPRRDYPLIDRFLRELGSDLRLADEEACVSDAALTLTPPRVRHLANAGRCGSECSGG